MSAPDALDAIVAEAAALDAESAPVLPGQAEAAPAVDPAEEWREAVTQGAGLVLSVYPDLKPEWTPARLDSLGNALAKCADHYGWTLGALFGHPLVGLAFASWPLAVPLVRISKQQAEAKQRAAVNRGDSQGAAVVAGKPESVFSRAGNLELSPNP